MFYFTIENILIPNQYGFRSDNTKTDCLVDLIDEITLALDEGYYAVSLFLDLSKAFDTVKSRESRTIEFGFEFEFEFEFELDFQLDFELGFELEFELDFELRFELEFELKLTIKINPPPPKNK